MASSSDYGKSKFNLAAQGHRQPGSVFKIMTLMTALRKGVNPDSTSYVSKPLKFNDPQWGPIETKTYDNSYRGSMSLTGATLASDNTVYMQLALDLGPPEVKQTAIDMGIRTKLDGYPAESLGGLTLGVSPLEMANAFATIASGGMRNRPTAITKITFPDGSSELPRRFKVKRTRAFEDGVTAKATEILVKNIQGGTGGKAEIGCPAGGKTGTTDSFNDAWFVGFTPRLATATWVGYPDAQVEMQTEYHGGSVAGGTFPAEIWGDYMKAVKGKFCGDFPPPKTPFQSSPFFGKYSRGGGSGHGRQLRPELERHGRLHAVRAGRAGARDRGQAGDRRRRRERRRGRRQRRRRQRQRRLRPRPLRVAAPGSAARRWRPGRRGAGSPTVDRGRTPGINPRSARPSGGLSMREGSALAPPRA